MKKLPYRSEIGSLFYETNNWTAEDLAYYPPNSNIPYYPFKNIN